jgi:ABC-type multidrug transport system ATPase subunit
LVGNILITEGYGIINDINITDENVKHKYKRKLIGLCPQHVILKEELTPYEHIELYPQLKIMQKAIFLKLPK